MSNPLLTETPVVTINGVQKNLPRLSISTTFSIISLLKSVVTPESFKLFTEEGEDSEFERGMKIFSVVFETLEGSEEKIYKTLAKVLEITKEEAENLNLEELVEAAIAYKEHPDVGFFTKRLPVIVKKQVTAPLAAPMTN